MKFCLVKVKYFWFKWSLDKGERRDAALFNSTIVSIFMFFLLFMMASLTLDLFFETTLTNVYYHLIPGTGFGERRLWGVSFVCLIIAVFRIIQVKLFNKRKTRFRKEFEKYMDGDLVLNSKEKRWIRVYLIILPLSLVMISLLYLFLNSLR